jgi:hypothetical protein
MKMPAPFGDFPNDGMKESYAKHKLAMTLIGVDNPDEGYVFKSSSYEKVSLEGETEELHLRDE